MTPEFGTECASKVQTPEDHMDALMASFEAAWRVKYMRGQDEHGGRLWRKRTTGFLIEEVLDFVSYVGVLVPQLKRVEELLDEGIRANNISSDHFDRARNILRVGNEEGVAEEEK